MAESEETRPILDALRADRSTARERQSAMEKQIKAEARRLRSGGEARAFLLGLDPRRRPLCTFLYAESHVWWSSRSCCIARFLVPA